MDAVLPDTIMESYRIVGDIRSETESLLDAVSTSWDSLIELSLTYIELSLTYLADYLVAIEAQIRLMCVRIHDVVSLQSTSSLLRNDIGQGRIHMYATNGGHEE